MKLRNYCTVCGSACFSDHASPGTLCPVHRGPPRPPNDKKRKPSTGRKAKRPSKK